MTEPVTGARMTGRQIRGGLIFLPFYIFILQFAVGVIYTLVIRREHTVRDAGIMNLINYYIYFMAVIVIFRQYLADSLKVFASNFIKCVKYIILGFILINVLNLVLSYVLNYLRLDFGNVNDSTIFEYLKASRGAIIASAVFLGPVAEEAIFRGLIFDNIRRRSRALAYISSCLAFALLHVWQPAFFLGDMNQLILIVEYLPAGIVLAWSFERSKTIWTPIALHMALNFVSVALAAP